MKGQNPESNLLKEAVTETRPVEVTEGFLDSKRGPWVAVIQSHEGQKLLDPVGGLTTHPHTLALL